MIWRLSSRLPKERDSLSGILLPTIMDPATIVTIASVLGGLLSCVQGISDAIDRAQQTDTMEQEALKELRRTIAEVEDDIKFFNTMVSVLGSTENENNLPFLQGSAISCRLLIVVILGRATNILLQARC
jgi:hypothetical protein